jgi:hypothetical protein
MGQEHQLGIPFDTHLPDDDTFLRGLVARGEVVWEVFGSEGRYRVVGREFLLHDTFPRGVWSLFGLPFSIGVKVLRGGLAWEWIRLDWAALEAERARLNENFRGQPDF